MYTIYADGQLLYSPTEAEEGYAVFDPKLTMELNKAGSLEFTMPPSNVMYDQLQKLKTYVTVEQDGTEIWRGRVLHDEKDFYLNDAISSTSASTPLGSLDTSTHERAGLLVKYSA